MALGFHSLYSDEASAKTTDSTFTSGNKPRAEGNLYTEVDEEDEEINADERQRAIQQSRAASRRLGKLLSGGAPAKKRSSPRTKTEPKPKKRKTPIKKKRTTRRKPALVKVLQALCGDQKRPKPRAPKKKLPKKKPKKKPTKGR